MRGKGFTLVELLVTISILAILMSIAMISYSNIQKNTRDAKRKSDLATIQAALEQYHADLGYYPEGYQSDIGSVLSSGSKIYLSQTPGGGVAYRGKPQGCDNITIKCTNYCLYVTVENNTNAVFNTICNIGNVNGPVYYYQVSAP